MPIPLWPQYADHPPAPKCRSRPGSNMPVGDNFRKFKSVQKHGLYAVPTFVPAQADFQLVLLTKIAFGVGKILIDKRR
jgi:hypothetical protein